MNFLTCSFTLISCVCLVSRFLLFITCFFFCFVPTSVVKIKKKKKKKQLSFLDVEINITDNGFESWAWRKRQIQELFLITMQYVLNLGKLV